MTHENLEKVVRKFWTEEQFNSFKKSESGYYERPWNAAVGISRDIVFAILGPETKIKPDKLPFLPNPRWWASGLGNDPLEENYEGFIHSYCKTLHSALFPETT